MATTTKKSTKATTSTKSKAASTAQARSILEGTPPATAKPAPKAATAKAAAPKKPVTPKAAPKASPVTTAAPKSVIMGPVMRKKELLEAVVERSGKKKKDAKPIVEAVLAELGEALAQNRELNLQPMGKLKVTREKQMPNGRVVVAKIRQPKKSQSTT